MNTKGLKIGLITSFILLSGLGTGEVKAQGVSLSIYPPVIQVEATPPSSPTAPIIIQNNEDKQVELQIGLIPFKASGTTGNIQPMPSLLTQGFYPYYKSRIQFLEGDKKTESVKVAPFESKEILVNINLSKGDPPGDYYYSIIFTASGSQAKENSYSQIPVGIASNLLLTVGPKGISSGGISEFSTTTFKTGGPVGFILKFHNASPHLVEPTGEISITNILGKEIGSVRILPQYVLAGTDRYLLDAEQASSGAYLNKATTPQIVWPEKFLLGWYKAEASIQLEKNGRWMKASTYFIAFPLYFFIPIVGLVFVALSIYLRVKRKV